MLFQVVVGSVMHALDVMSDVYVIYLWYQSGRVDLFIAGIFFMVFSTIATARLGLNYLNRSGRSFRTRCIFVLLAPFNFHNYVFGYFVLKDKRDVFSWESFSLLKVMHSGLESTPFALVTGIDLLSSNISNETGFLVKVTSFGLSVFSVTFSVIVQTYLTNGWPGTLALDFMCHAGLDVLLTVMSVGYNIDALGARYGALTVCLGLGIIGVGVFYVLHDLHRADRSTVTFLEDIMRPYSETFGWPESHVHDVHQGKGHVAWIIPFISLGTLVMTGACLFMFDMLYALPQPAAQKLADRKEKKELRLAVVRRSVIYGLCAVFVAFKFSKTKLCIVAVCVPAHIFFTLRCRGLLRSFSVAVLIYRCLSLAFSPFYLLLLAANAVERCFSNFKQADAEQKAQAELALTTLTRPHQVTGEEEELYALCEKHLSEMKEETQKPGCACKAELEQLIEAITRFGHRVTELLNGAKLVDIDAVKDLLASIHSMTSQEELSRIARSLNEANFCIPEHAPNWNDPALESIATKQKSVRLVPGDADVEEEGDSAQFRAVRFRTVANALIWFDQRPDKNSFALSKKTATADFFLSHCWKDSPEAKASLLRSFLWVQTTVAVTLSATLLFAMALLPTGIILSELSGVIVWWSPCVFVLCFGSLLLLWTVVSHFTGTHSAYVPWYASRISCWLDKCCINQKSPETKKAGIAHLGESLSRCNCMIVIFSKQYLERMWCTYELAAYCKLMQDDPGKKLVFLSLSWSAWYSPSNFGKKVELSEDEEDALRTYSCKNAKLYKREDRDIVLRKIEEQWGTVEQFDAFVRKDLREALLRGKEAYYEQFKNVLVQSCALLFG